MFSRKILIFYVLFSIFSLNAEESAYASFVQGKAIFYASSGIGLGLSKLVGIDKPTQVEQGHIFEKGNFILVGKGKVDVTYKEGPVISLLKDSKYIVNDKSGKLDQGGLFFNNKKADDKDFKINVKTYTVGVRGTEFLLDMEGVYVRSGEVEVTKNGVFGGETMIIRSNQQMLFDEEIVTIIDPEKDRYIDNFTDTRSNADPVSNTSKHSNDLNDTDYYNNSYLLDGEYSQPYYQYYYHRNNCR